MRIAILTTDKREADHDYARPEPLAGHAPAALLEGFALLPEIEVHMVSCLKKPVNSPAKIAPNIFYHGLQVSPLGWMRTGYLGCIRATRKKLREIRPDIVHGQGTERDCGISAAFSGFPNVLTIHGNMKAIAENFQSRPGSFHWLAAQLETFALKHVTGAFCNSAYTEKQVAPRAKKTWRVANAIQAEFFRPIAPKPSRTRPVLLNAGTTLPYKQQLELLGMARQLHARGLRFEFQFAGGLGTGTEYGAAFARELAQAESAGYARHLGLLSPAELRNAMDAADALVHFPTEEAFGLVVAEALARNLKLFAATTGGIVDIAEGVTDAELFPAADFVGLENAIARWLAAGCPGQSNAAGLMQARYHPKIIAQRHLEIYLDILGPQRKA
ncbi:MAG TPA: glycosyltransferase [Candidatus Acidoferrales bacterium]|jgi:glycosyltransferase involved in cell wall biosynthesis|nr:glycosyltransferase [Candidatus Acidoferrales bacterium]